MDDMLVNMALAILLGVIKNPDKAKKLRAALKKVHDAIELALPDVKS